jgi:hypothetical protein
MTTLTPYGYWTNYETVTCVEDTVADFLGCTVVMNPRITVSDSDIAADFDVEGLVDAYRDAINDALPADITLAGNDFLGPYPRRDGSVEEIKAAIEAVDLGELAQRFDRSAG